MTLTLVRRATLPVALGALVALLLLAPTASAAKRVPPLPSTAQYKAFTKYVAKLRGMRGTPATAARKAELEDTLTARHGAVVSRSTALFKQSKRVAKSRAQGHYAASAQKVRMTESQELAEIRADTTARLERALDSLDRGIGAVEDFYDDAGARLKRQLKAARRQRAKATKPLDRARFVIQIASLEKQLVDNRKDEARARKRFRDRYSKEKRAIQATKAEETTKIRESDQSAINRLRRSRERAYRLRVATADARRATQLASLEDKLDAGRLAIAEMPLAAG